MPATTEKMVEIWEKSKQEVQERMQGLFSQKRVAKSAELFLESLLGNEPRKTGWMRAEAAGDKGPWRQQAILGRGRWDAHKLRDLVRNYVMESFGEEEGILAIDETGFLKKGKASCGVGSQYTGSVGKIANCQIGVFAAYVSSKGHALIDRKLYLPKEWVQDKARRQAVSIPSEEEFASKPAIARKMIKEAVEAKVPFFWMVADSVYGTSEVTKTLREAGKGYVLGTTSRRHYYLWDDKEKGVYQTTAAEIAHELSADQWKRLSAGDGTKGARLYDWAYLKWKDIEGCKYNKNHTGLWTPGLLIRRNIEDQKFSYYITWCPVDTPLETLVSVLGSRWRIEECFETAKTEFGLDHNETRSWHGWHRHTSLVMLAFALVATIRYRANHVDPHKKTISKIPLPASLWFTGLFKKFDALSPG
jgi:SRSO17 transposase